MPITTLFFDLDGTVSNNFLGISRCLNFALERLGERQLSDAEVLPFVGPPFRESLPRTFPGIDTEAALALYRQRYDAHGWLENRLYDGIAAAIRALHLQGFTIALCTSKPRIFAERIITHFELARYFVGIHGPELDGTFDRKTDLLAHLVRHYKTPPASALPLGGGELALQPATFTPYDRYLGSVRTGIANLDPHPTTMTLAARLMKEGRRMRYCLSDPYRADPPSVTAGRRAGDCKSKALWLYDGLGDPNALFVIGKVQKRARSSHAWVYWRYDDRWWILDCTERADPIAADSVGSDRYVPYYSFGKSGAFRHRATSLILTGAITPSASPVAAKR